MDQFEKIKLLYDGDEADLQYLRLNVIETLKAFKHVLLREVPGFKNGGVYARVVNVAGFKRKSTIADYSEIELNKKNFPSLAFGGGTQENFAALLQKIGAITPEQLKNKDDVNKQVLQGNTFLKANGLLFDTLPEPIAKLSSAQEFAKNIGDLISQDENHTTTFDITDMNDFTLNKRLIALKEMGYTLELTVKQPSVDTHKL